MWYYIKESSITVLGTIILSFYRLSIKIAGILLFFENVPELLWEIQFLARERAASISFVLTGDIIAQCISGEIFDCLETDIYTSEQRVQIPLIQNLAGLDDGRNSSPAYSMKVILLLLGFHPRLGLMRSLGESLPPERYLRSSFVPD